MINKISNILAGVDFSDPSLNALETAASLAAKCNAALYIIHAHDNTLESIASGLNYGSIKKGSVANNSSDILTAMGNDVGKKYNIKPIIIEQEGQANEAILRAAVSQNCELIVLGSYGASGYRSGSIGYTAYSVIKHAMCPVLIIPSNKKWLHFKKPIYAVRPVATALRHLELLSEFLEPNANVNIFGIYPQGETENFYDLNHLVSKTQPAVNSNIKLKLSVCETSNAIPQNILSEAGKNQSDLIVISPATDLSTKAFYIGPNTHYIIQNAKIPLLIIDKVNKYSMERLRTSF